MSHSGEQPCHICYIGIISQDMIDRYNGIMKDYNTIDHDMRSHVVKIETEPEPEPKLDFGSKQRLRGRNKRQKRKQLYQSK